MPNPTTHTPSPTNEQSFFLFLLLAMGGIYLIYQAGFPALWTFDDWMSLNGLSGVIDFDSAMTYVFGNTTGPTGRPIAIASFLINSNDWPDNPAGFRQINTSIHLLNILLVALAAWQVARLIPALNNHAAGFAVLLALFWGLHPLFASAVLSAVQRMALLSVSFMLLGINGFLYGRSYTQTHPLKAAFIMAASLGIALPLATFSKENGALLPSFVGLLEITLLSRFQPIRLAYWRNLTLLLLWGPILLFLGYVLFFAWPGIVDAQNGAYRAFTWNQRLWSEPLILWEYVRQLFIPDVQSMGPLQDDSSRIHGTDIYTLGATTAWLLILSLAWRSRKAYPLFLFSIGFFLIGHLIESSFIQLELYFEHRNYFPSLGLLLLPTTGIYLCKLRLLRLLAWGGLLPLLAFLLYLATSTWGDPQISSKTWYEHHPTSLRALQKRIKVVEVIQGLASAADLATKASAQNPHKINIAALALSLQCAIPDAEPAEPLVQRIEQLAHRPHPLRGSLGFLGFMESVVSLRLEQKCTWFSRERLKNILILFLQDPAIVRHPADLSRLHTSIGLLDLADGDTLAGLNHLQQGFQLHSNYQLFALYVHVLRQLGQAQAAEALKNSFLSTLPAGVYSMSEHRRRVEAALIGQ